MPKFFDPANQSKRMVAQVTIYPNKITLTGTSGTANITINGILNATIATFVDTLTNAAAAWVAANYDHYYARGFVVSSSGAVITVLPKAGWDTVNRINASISAAVTGNLTGTVAGTFEPNFAIAKIWQVTFGQNITIKRPLNMVEGDRIRLELKATGGFTTTWDTDGFFFPGGTENVQTSTSIDLVQGNVNVSMWPRQDRVTITGTEGTANVTVGGLTKLATFNASLNQTATDFVTAHAAAYAEIGITVTAGTALLIFVYNGKLATDGLPSPSIAGVSGDLAGTVVRVPRGRVLCDAAAKDIKQ
jgi:hypothetical protein